MKKFLYILLLFVPLGGFAQNSKWSIALIALPELTFYRERYPADESSNKSSVNPGAAASLHYRCNQSISVTGGLSYVSRRFTTKAELDESALPGRQGAVNGLPKRVTNVTYRIISVPVGVNVYLRRNATLRPYLSAGLAANVLLNSSYTTNTLVLDERYRRNELMGMSISLGGGFDYKLRKRLLGTAALSYSLMNAVLEDRFLRGSQSGQALTHSFLNLGLGVKYAL